MGIVVPYLMGGLGNWLFQTATALYLGKESALLSESRCSRSPHSSTDYFKTILKNIRKGEFEPQLRITESENMEEITNTEALRAVKTHNVLLYGYFQNWKYVPEGFGDMLEYKNPALLQKYPDIGRMCFLHVRGRDYVNHPLHDIGLSDRYYPSCIQFMKEKGFTKFAVFTNDRDYCSRRGFLKDVEYQIIDENELDTLYLMTECGAGITANSSFSWWGAYLNRKRPLCLPSRWFNDPTKYIGGYFFPGCVVHQV